MSRIQEFIEAELNRCNYTSEIGNFKAIVKGHLDHFDTHNDKK